MDIRTDVLTTNKGWITLGDIQVGDKVYNSTGNLTNVRNISKSFIPQIAFEIQFNTGETFICGPFHGWKTLTSNEVEKNLKRGPEWRAKRREKRPSRAVPTPKRPNQSKAAMISNSLRTHNYLEKNIPKFRELGEIQSTLYARANRLNHILEITPALQSEDTELEIDPYSLGMFLGDGGAASTMLTMEIKDWHKIKNKIPYKVVYQKTQGKTANIYLTRLKGLRRDLQKVLTQHVQVSPSGRQTKIFDKFIPNSVFNAPFNQRLNLLKGLMDTDGTVAKEKGSCEVGFSNYELAIGTLRLLSSLGIKSSIKEKKVQKGERHFRMVFMSEKSVFNLPRKKDLQRMTLKKEYSKRRYIKNIKPHQPVRMRYIEVKNPDEGILLGNTLIATKFYKS